MDTGIRNPANPSADTPPVYEAEFQALAEMIGYDMPEVLVDLLDTYLEESDGLVKVIGTLGRTDLESQTFMRAAHSLKSSSASIGAIPLSVLCADLENHLRGLGDKIDVESQVARIEREYTRVRNDLEARKETLLNT